MEKGIVIVNYGMGNLFSIMKVIDTLGFPSIISESPQDIRKASKLILPGVGHFGKAMQNLQRFNLLEALNEVVLVKQIPVLGICLGMQLMAAHSEEGDAAGLNWFDARVIKFRINNKELYKVPHIGWNTISHDKPDSYLLKDLKEEDEFYFVHSYHIATNKTGDILTNTTYEYRFVSAIEKDNISGVQFHPEKSHRAGQQMIKNFLNR